MHTFYGTIHSIREPKAGSKAKNHSAFVLFNAGDYFGASIFLHPAQVEALEVNDYIEVSNAQLSVKRDEDEGTTYVNVKPARDVRWLTINKVAKLDGAPADQGEAPTVGEVTQG